MYVDDTSISFPAPTNYDLEIMINTELAYVNSWLKANKLSLNVAKTEFMVIGSRQRLQTQAEVSIQTHIECNEIKRVESSKSLGLTIAETLSWSNSPGARGTEMIFYTARVLKRFDDDFNRLKPPL